MLLDNNERHFLAFVRDSTTGESTITAGVDYDIAFDIDQKNQWLECGENDQELVRSVIQIAARGLNELMMFCFRGIKIDAQGRGLRTAIRRFMAVAWMLKSNEIVDKNKKPLSLDRIGKLKQVRCSRCALSLLAQEFGAQWGFRVRVQKRETTKSNYAKAAHEGWKKRRKRESGGNK